MDFFSLPLFHLRTATAREELSRQAGGRKEKSYFFLSSSIWPLSLSLAYFFRFERSEASEGEEVEDGGRMGSC